MTRSLLLLLLVAAFVLTGSSPGPGPASTPAIQEQANIGFQWAFGAVVGKDRKFVSITHDTTLSTGEEVKMLVQLTKECYVYVLHYGSNGEIDLLFPYSFRQFQTDYETGKNYFIPKGRDWSRLDKNTGRETFFIVASTERQLDLEAKVGDYLAADASKKEGLAKAIVSNVRDLRRKYTTFATIAEKPLTIGGNIRGTDKVETSRRPDVTTIATEVTARNFYSKTITIDHQ